MTTAAEKNEILMQAARIIQEEGEAGERKVAEALRKSTGDGIPEHELQFIVSYLKVVGAAEAKGVLEHIAVPMAEFADKVLNPEKNWGR